MMKRDVEWIRACLKSYAQLCWNTEKCRDKIGDLVRQSAKSLSADESDIQYALDAVRNS